VNASEIQNEIERNHMKYNYFGIRSMTPSPITGKETSVKVGEGLPNSYHWDDGDTTGVEINGVCAIGINIDSDVREIEKALKSVSKYDGDQIVLIGAYGKDYGDDDGEVILRNCATVIAIIRN
jgi:hypothetical protein